MKKVERWSDIPTFANDHEEHHFWPTHELAGEALESMREGAPGDLPPPEAFRQLHPRTRPVSVRLDNDILRRLKAVAAKKREGLIA